MMAELVGSASRCILDRLEDPIGRLGERAACGCFCVSRGLGTGGELAGRGFGRSGFGRWEIAGSQPNCGIICASCTRFSGAWCQKDRLRVRCRRRLFCLASCGAVALRRVSRELRGCRLVRSCCLIWGIVESFPWVCQGGRRDRRPLRLIADGTFFRGVK
jgi:hypothetical protein